MLHQDEQLQHSRPLHAMFQQKLTCGAVLMQLARLRIQLQQQGIALPDGPRVSADMHQELPPEMRNSQVNTHTSGDSAVSLPVSHISPR